jgi:hypothetical protein
MKAGDLDGYEIVAGDRDDVRGGMRPGAGGEEAGLSRSGPPPHPQEAIVVDTHIDTTMMLGREVDHGASSAHQGRGQQPRRLPRAREAADAASSRLHAGTATGPEAVKRRWS